MGILDFFRRAKGDPELQRRAQLLRRGRITDGAVSDVVTDDTGQITHVFFSYEINGVDYEASQSLDDAQRQRQSDYIPGSHITVRYNPHQPGNSVVV